MDKKGDFWRVGYSFNGNRTPYTYFLPHCHLNFTFISDINFFAKNNYYLNLRVYFKLTIKCNPPDADVGRVAI